MTSKRLNWMINYMEGGTLSGSSPSGVVADIAYAWTGLCLGEELNARYDRDAHASLL